MENRKYTPCGHEDLYIIKQIWFLDEWVLNTKLLKEQHWRDFTNNL
jgi:hypothetical protein